MQRSKGSRQQLDEIFSASEAASLASNRIKLK